MKKKSIFLVVLLFAIILPVFSQVKPTLMKYTINGDEVLPYNVRSIDYTKMGNQEVFKVYYRQDTRYYDQYIFTPTSNVNQRVANYSFRCTIGANTGEEHAIAGTATRTIDSTGSSVEWVLSATYVGQSIRIVFQHNS